MSQSRQIQCVACGNADNSKYSFVREGAHHYIVCHMCNARSLVIEPPEYVVQQEGTLENAINLLELGEFYRAEQIFNTLCTQNSTDPRSWYGYARAVSHDFSRNEKNVLSSIDKACQLAGDNELQDSYNQVRAFLESKVVLNETESNWKKKIEDKSYTAYEIESLIERIEVEEKKYEGLKKVLSEKKKKYDQVERRKAGLKLFRPILMIIGIILLGFSVVYFVISDGDAVSLVAVSFLVGLLLLLFGSSISRKLYDNKSSWEYIKEEFEKQSEETSRVEKNLEQMRKDLSKKTATMENLNKEIPALSEQIDHLRNYLQNTQFKI